MSTDNKPDPNLKSTIDMYLRLCPVCTLFRIRTHSLYRDYTKCDHCGFSEEYKYSLCRARSKSIKDHECECGRDHHVKEIKSPVLKGSCETS